MIESRTGAVTLLCANMEGSARLRQQLGDRFAGVLSGYRRILETVTHSQGGSQVDTQEDVSLFAFPRAHGALTAAVAALRAINRYPWPAGGTVRVRMGLHAVQPPSARAGSSGVDVRRAASICAAGHWGQILVSETVRDLAADDLPKQTSLRDLGKHRLKDLALPQHLFQIVHPHVPSEFPPIRSLEVLPHNLPLQLTSFIGREREIAQVRGFLSTTRLLTLTGAGGAGKTRLALQVAAEALEDLPDGVWVVDLAPLADPGLVTNAAASVLSVSEQPGRLLIDTLVAALRDKSVLLVLDNCEHVQSACAHLAEALLRGCQHLRILATSRVPLGVLGETLWRVPSLSLPDARRVPSRDDIQQCEAVRLFVERARSSEPTFVLTTDNAPAVVQLCQRLDGIPLAIELAAPRVRVLAVEQIAARLDDRFRLLTGGSSSGLPRHQTLRATMDWSYGLLADKEQILLGRLSVFAGGWTLEAAEAICVGNRVEAVDILDVLTQLLDKSLVMMEAQTGEARYRLLETVRQYGQDRLREAGEADEVQRRHRDWYLELAERADSGLRGSEEGVWLTRLETEHDNLRAALEWSKKEKDGAENELRLARALEWFWHLLGHWTEGRTRLEEVCLRSNEASPFLPKAIVGAARLAYRQGDHGRARALCERGLVLSRELGDKTGTACFLIWLGILAMAEADHEGAIPLLEDSLALFREVGDKWWTVEALSFLGTLAAMQGDYKRAAVLHLESLALGRETGSINNITTALRNLGHMALRQGDYERAGACYTESLVLSREVKTPGVITECLDGLARVACARAEYERAARLFGAAEASFEALSGQLPLWSDISEHDRYVASTRTGLSEAACAAAWGEGRTMTLERAVAYALGSPRGTPPEDRKTEKTGKDSEADLLTPREQEIAALVARGLTNRQIAAKLVVTERTAETHVQNILNKLGFTSRAQIAAWAVEQGLGGTGQK